MNNSSKHFSVYSGEIAIHDLVLAYNPPLELSAALVLDIEDADESSALVALTPISLAALQTILDFGLEGFINEVNLIDYPLYHLTMSKITLLDTDDKISQCLQNLSRFQNSLSNVIGEAKNIFDSQKNFQL